MKKRCPKCKKIKSLKSFSKDKTRKDGLQPCCKICHAKYQEENKDKIAKYQKKYRDENREKIKKQKTIWRKENKEKLSKQMKKYYELQYQENLESDFIIRRFTTKKSLTKFIKQVVPKCLYHFKIIWHKGCYTCDFTLTNKYIKFEVPVRYILK